MITVINGYWKLFAQSIGCSFLFISGVSFWVIANNEIETVMNPNPGTSFSSSEELEDPSDLLSINTNPYPPDLDNNFRVSIEFAFFKR